MQDSDTIRYEQQVPEVMQASGRTSRGARALSAPEVAPLGADIAMIHLWNRIAISNHGRA